MLTLSLNLGEVTHARNKGGGGAPAGFSWMTDETGALLTDEWGAGLYALGEPTFASSAAIAEIASSRNILFGAAFDVSEYNSDAPYAALLNAESNIYGVGSDMKPAVTQPSQGVFDFTRADAFAARAALDEKPFRLHLLNYPAKELPWMTDEVCNAATWQGLIDAHFEAYAARPWAQSVTSIDVTNEIMDGEEANPRNGFRDTVWYRAGGPGWVTYMFQKARALWPNTPLYMCHDRLEQLTDGYGQRQAAWFLQMLENQLNAGAPITGVNFQCHLSFRLGFDAKRLRDFCEDIKSLGLKIMIGEFDVRTGNVGQFVPSNYTVTEYDRQGALLARQVWDVLLPEVDGGEVLVWGLTDNHNSWEAGERPCLYDESNVKKPLYDEVRNAFLGIS